MLRTLILAIRALRGFRTYQPDFGCNCPECISPNRPGLVGWRYRLNQPPFRSED